MALATAPGRGTRPRVVTVAAPSGLVERVGFALGVLAGRRARNLVTAEEEPPSTGSIYEGASTSRRTLGWIAPTVSPNQAVIQALEALRRRSRAAARNNPIAGAALDRLVTNIVGTGLKPQSDAPDRDFRDQIQRLWNRWTDESDADGVLDWCGQQALAVRNFLEAGESFVRLRDRLPEDGFSVPLQLQLIEPDHCPHLHSRDLGGRRIKAGIEFSAIGRRQAYWFHPSRPGEFLDFDPSQLVRVDAAFVLHLYDPARPGQLRGTPALTRALVKLHELDKFDDATLLRQQLANMLVGFFKRPAGLPNGASLDPQTGGALQTDDQGRPLTKMEPGTFIEGMEGEELTWSAPPGPGDIYPDYVREQLLLVAIGAGVPYEVLTGDMRGVNDRTMRVLLLEFRRKIMMIQHQIVAFQLCRPIWNAWLDRVFVSGALPTPAGYWDDPEPWRRVKWMAHGWPYLNPVQDIQSGKDAVRSGFTSRRSQVSETGEDAEVIDAEQRADNERADALGLKYDSDGRRPADGKAPVGALGAQPGPGGGGDDGDPTPGDSAAAYARAQLQPIQIIVQGGKPTRMRVLRDKHGRVSGVEPVEDAGG